SFWNDDDEGPAERRIYGTSDHTVLGHCLRIERLGETHGLNSARYDSASDGRGRATVEEPERSASGKARTSRSYGDRPGDSAADQRAAEASPGEVAAIRCLDQIGAGTDQTADERTPDNLRQPAVGIDVARGVVASVGVDRKELWVVNGPFGI